VSAQFGKWTALPHGSATPQRPRRRHRDDRRRSRAGYDSVSRARSCSASPQPNRCGKSKRAQAKSDQLRGVDAAARVIVDAALVRAKVQDYRRTGPYRDRRSRNFVRNKTPIRPGMCFSDEPMLAIQGTGSSGGHPEDGCATKPGPRSTVRGLRWRVGRRAPAAGCGGLARACLLATVREGGYFLAVFSCAACFATTSPLILS
jgi:hypothetical protein